MKVLATLALLLIAVGSTFSYPQDYLMDDAANYPDDYEDGEHEDEGEVDYSNLEVPKFAVEAQTYTVVEGGDIDISCAVSGKTPYVAIVKKVAGEGEEKEQLLFVGNVKVSNKNKFEIKAGVVTIRNVKREDAGDYMCYFETEPVVEIIHKLDVQYAPTVSSSTPKNQRIVKGSSVTLECEATEPCRDISPICSTQLAYCHNNNFVRGRCQRSCGFCQLQETCRDISPNCPANLHQCHSSDFVRGRCQRSCGFCHTSNTVNDNILGLINPRANH